jgi:cell division control protein 7
MVMPYFELVSFTEYYDKMTVDEVRSYMRSLLSSLAVLAEKGWVHRDVKPCNFIHRPANWKNSGCPARYMLIDFGLAQEESELRRKAYLQERRLQIIYDKGKKVKSLRDIDEDSYTTAPPANDEDCFWVSSAENKRTKKSGFKEEALDNNTLPVPERAGTRGYRAPEVLCRTWHQGPALDVWSSGVILLCILTRIYPFFEASDDIHALAEIVHIVGKRAVQLAANRVNRCFKVRNNQSKERWSSFSNFAKGLLSKHIAGSNVAGVGQVCRKAKCVLEVKCSYNCPKAAAEWPKEMWELLDHLLTIDQLDRITAKAALKLPFFSKSLN